MADIETDHLIPSPDPITALAIEATAQKDRAQQEAKRKIGRFHAFSDNELSIIYKAFNCSVTYWGKGGIEEKAFKRLYGEIVAVRREANK